MDRGAGSLRPLRLCGSNFTARAQRSQRGWCVVV